MKLVSITKQLLMVALGIMSVAEGAAGKYGAIAPMPLTIQPPQCLHQSMISNECLPDAPTFTISPCMEINGNVYQVWATSFNPLSAQTLLIPQNTCAIVFTPSQFTLKVDPRMPKSGATCVFPSNVSINPSATSATLNINSSAGQSCSIALSSSQPATCQAQCQALVNVASSMNP
ncbi:MAG TPA: hypothetical protein VJB02_00935 [Coxiellaceae bacterium]|nr:hypothetical protein [Coxiellaceae bacterium]